MFINHEKHLIMSDFLIVIQAIFHVEETLNC